VIITNKIRGGVGLVLCEGIAQKAKKLMKEVKGYGLGWDWLSNIIKVEAKKSVSESDTAVFLEELVAGRPILAYPGHAGGFRLRYGRSRMTGIAAKGFSPATMILTMGFVATGTQLKVEMPGKGCVASPVDSIEGPFVRLKSGEALRINDADTAERLKGEIEEIIYLGDILVTYGDFRKSNTPLQPSSYVEEFWERQLESKSDPLIKPASMHFPDIYKICMDKSLPMHPKYLYEFQALRCEQIASLAGILFDAVGKERTLNDIDSLTLPNAQEAKRSLELLSVPHSLSERGE
jgi:DNA polymerase II large subunit DP2.